MLGKMVQACQSVEMSVNVGKEAVYTLCGAPLGYKDAMKRRKGAKDSRRVRECAAWVHCEQYK